MATVPKDPEREHRILYEAVVDAYDEVERAMGWYCYLNDRLSCPFPATRVGKAATSPLRVDETVEVLGLADVEECEHDVLVTVRWRESELAVPLSQLRPATDDGGTRQAVEDWHYWVARGYQF